MSALSAFGLAKSYRGVAALQDFTLAVPSGTRAAVVGPSGSGKTTLLRLVAGFERPDRGRIELDGAIMADEGSAVPVHRRGIGIVAQDGALFPHLSLADNIGFGLPRRAPDRIAIVRDLMDKVELARAWADKRPHELSGGQQQRVALARALALKPRLMLLDEPFSALDAGLRESTRRAVASVLGEAGVTTILVTHDQAEALSFADQVAVLRDGRLVQAGSPREVYFRPVDPAVAALLGDAVTLPAELRDGHAHCLLGRIPVEGGRSGPATIMLRPEQVRLGPELPDGPGGGRLVAVEFGGGACLATVAFGDGRPVALRVATAGLPPVGSPVSVVVTGPAHVFAEPAPSREAPPRAAPPWAAPPWAAGGR